MIWNHMPFDESNDRITVTGVMNVGLGVAMALAGIFGAICTIGSLFVQPELSVVWLGVGIGGMAVMCGFAWMLGLKARALNTLIFCCAVAAGVWIIG